MQNLDQFLAAGLAAQSRQGLENRQVRLAPAVLLDALSVSDQGGLVREPQGVQEGFDENALADPGLAFDEGDLAAAGRLYAAGWDHGTPGRPGVRVHFPGTRQERLVPADEVVARYIRHRARLGSRDVGSQAVSRRLEVLVGPRLDVRAGTTSTPHEACSRPA